MGSTNYRVLIVWGQDGASAPAIHLNSPRPYIWDIWHPILGGTTIMIFVYPVKMMIYN